MAKGPTSLHDSDLLATHHRHYRVNLRAGTTLEDALKPEFWADIGKKMKPWDRFTLQAEEPTRFVAETIVTDAGHGFAKLKLLACYDLADEATVEEASEFDGDQFKAKHMGFGKWAVIRRSDGKALKGDFASKEDAQLYAINHQRSVLA